MIAGKKLYEQMCYAIEASQYCQKSIMVLLYILQRLAVIKNLLK